jgi:hypothetical protein
MISSVYDVWLSDPLGKRIGNLTAGIDTLSWIKNLGNIGWFELIFTDKSFDVELDYALDRRIEIWRRSALGNKRLIQLGMMRKRNQVLRNGKMVARITGPDMIHMLHRRIIEQEQNLNVYNVDRVMYLLVDDALGPNALRAQNDISNLGFTLNPLGPPPSTIVTGVTLLNKKLLEGLQELTQATTRTGNTVYFDMIYNRSDQFAFQTYNYVRGVDRTVGNQRKIISADFDNISDPGLVEDRTNESTVIYPLPISSTQYESADRIGASPFNVIARTVTVNRNFGEDVIADAALKASAPVISFTGEIQDVPGNRFGVDWDYGDRLYATFAGEVVEVEVISVAARIGQDGKESLAGRIRQVTDV